MATETWTYALIWNEVQNYGLNSSKRSVSMILKRKDHTDRDSSLYVLKSSNGSIYSSGSRLMTPVSGNQTLKFGGYGNVEVGPSSNRWDFNGDTMTDIPSSILNIGSSGVSIAVTTSWPLGTGNAVFFYGSPQGSEIFTFTITVESKYSPSTFSAGNVEFGETSTVTISNTYINEMRHRVEWNCSGSVYAVDLAAGVTSASYVIPTEWMSKIPNATTITCTIFVYTYRGNSGMGSTSSTITLSVPASVRPTIASISAAVLHGHASFPDQYIQHICGVELQLGAVAANGYATIKSYSLAMTQTESYSFNSSTRKYTIDYLANNGNITFSVTVKDSRNRQSDPVAVTISVMEYAPPTIMATSAFRCNANGVAQESGTFASIRLTATYTPLAGNTITINSVYYESTTPSIRYVAKNGMTSGEEYIIGDGNLADDRTYYIEFTITDTMGQTVVETAIVQTASYVFHIKNGGVGIAMGKTCEKYNAVEIYKGWTLWYKGIPMSPVIFSETESGAVDPDTNQPFEGLVWLKPKG